ncbi:MAG: cell division protein FtsQ, partial [Desulfuromonadales bacterium]|nr:cell division protein FtsQ [Desulfuromonadales bacterium]NIS41007.1 cell division protein FtsQ [Desulfuromonadales bacterium]
NGEIFKVLSAEDRLDYPVITGIDRSFLLDKPEQGKELLENAMKIIDQLAERTIFSLDKVSEIHVDRKSSIALMTYRAGVPVQLGFRGH